MLPKTKKLNRINFTEAAKSSLKRDSDHFSVRIKHNMAEQSRFSVVIGGKIVKKAVERNTLKRKVYSILEKYTDKSGFWAIIYAKKGAGNLDFRALNKEITDLLTPFCLDKTK